jgi:DNA-binding SARP family transcriptional activator
VQFRILGPLEVRAHDGRLVTISAPKQRILLSRLLLHANRPVDPDSLVEALWPHRAPRSARTVLRTYASAVRLALYGHEGVDAPHLHWLPGGYRLDVPPGELDLAVFEDLAQQGERAASGGDLPLAAERLSGGLALWRGRLLEDVPLDGAVLATVAAIDERRLAVQQTWIETRLALGDHPGVIGELRAMIAQHPMLERLRGLLMSALAGAGRTVEALAVYADTRRLLVEELGIEPDERLQLLHREILAGSAAPGTGHATGLPGAEGQTGQSTDARGADSRAASPPAVPRQLPPAIGGLAGRRTELAALTRVIESAAPVNGVTPIALIDGGAGTGKTTLAVYWAHQVADRYPDGHLYVDLRGFDPGRRIVSASRAIRGFLDALGVPADRVPPGLSAQIGLYRSLTAGKRILILLDNARDAQHVRPLLPGTATAVVLVTSRTRLTPLAASHGAHLFTLGLLDEQEAVDLLALRLGPQRVAAEPQTVHEIVEACVRLPLALSVASARALAPEFPLSAMAAELRAEGRRLDALDTGDPGTQIRAVFSWSYRAVTPAAAELFRLLGTHPGPEICAAAAASLCGRPVSQTRHLLAELTRAHLLSEHTPGRYRGHDLLRAYAAELARTHDSRQQRRAARIRLLDSYSRAAHTADRLLNPSRDPIPLPLGRPVPGVAPVRLDNRDHAADWLTSQRPALMEVLRWRTADSALSIWQLAWSLSTYLDRYTHWHDLAVAGRSARSAARHVGDPGAQAFAHRLLARAHTLLDQPAQAHAQHDPAGDPRRALTDCRSSVSLHQQLGDRHGLATAWESLGYAHHHLGQHADAVDCYWHAVALFHDAGHRHYEAVTLIHLGDTHLAAGHRGAARAAWSRSLRILDGLDGPGAEQVRAKLAGLQPFD